MNRIPGDGLASEDGVGLSYQVVGSGPPIVLLHGLTANSRVNWEEPGVVDVINAAGWQAVLLDARGHGGSERPSDPESYTWDRHGGDVVALLDHLRLDRCVLAGYSLGAGTAAWLTPREPRVRAAVLGGIGLETISQFPPEAVDAMIPQLEAQAGDGDWIDQVATAHGRTLSWRYSLGATAASLRALQQPATFLLAEIDVPVLVLNGDADTSPDAIASLIPGAVTRCVPGDHLTAPLHPEFAAAIGQFLDGLTWR